MKTTTNEIRLTFTDTDQPLLFIPLNMSRREAVIAVEPLKQVIEQGKLLSVEIKPYRKKRSLDANNYCWLLCDKIAEVIRSTKEEVYREVIRRVGKFDYMLMHPEATETFIADWSSKGIGWFAEVEGSITINQIEFDKLIIYKGSSRYDTKQMARLIDELVSEAQELDIETRPEAEINSLLNEWEKR